MFIQDTCHIALSWTKIKIFDHHSKVPSCHQYIINSAQSCHLNIIGLSYSIYQKFLQQIKYLKRDGRPLMSFMSHLNFRGNNPIDNYLSGRRRIIHLYSRNKMRWKYIFRNNLFQMLYLHHFEKFFLHLIKTLWLFHYRQSIMISESNLMLSGT